MPWLLLGASVIVGVAAVHGTGRLDGCPTIGCDFFTYQRQAAALFTKPVEIDGGWLYPPLSALVFTPFVPLSVHAAVATWTAINVAMALVLVALCARPLGDEFGGASRWAIAAALVATSLPVAHSIKWGQVSLLVAIGAIYALNRSTITPPVLGFLTGMKLFPIGYVLGAVARRDARTTLATAGWAVAWGLVVPVAILGPDTTLRFFRIAFGAVRPFGDAPWASGRSAAFWGGAGLSPALVRWFRDGSHVGLSSESAPALLFSLPGPLVTVLSVALSVVVLVTSALRLRRPDVASDYAAALCLSAVTLVIQPAWHHYFAFMPYAHAVALSRSRGSGARRALVIASWGASALCFVLLAAMPTGYFRYSAWGGTTVSCLLVFAALVTLPNASAERRSVTVARGSSRPSV